MNKVRQWWWKFYNWGWDFPLVLLGVCLLSYGLLIARQGYAWDDWVFIWTARQLGPEGLARYFATNRPFWGMLVQLSTSVINEVPWHWQIFGLFWRWAAALAFWGLLRLTWPRYPRLAMWASLFFAVYPAFGQQSIAINYGHFFIVFACFLMSLSLMVVSVRWTGWRHALMTAFGLLLSLINLLTLEYFFLLDLLRPLFIFVVLRDAFPAWRHRIKQTWVTWLPYLGLFLGLAIWRAFFFRYQTQNYRLVLLEALQNQLFPALGALLERVFGDLWLTSIGAWLHAFTLPNPAEMGSRTLQVYGLLILLTLVGMLVFLFSSARRHPEGITGGLFWDRRSATESGGEKNERGGQSEGQIWLIGGIGISALLLAGGPFWLVGVPLGYDFPNSRFTIPFMVGSSLLLAGLLEGLRLDWLRIAGFSLLIAFSVGIQFQHSNAFRQDWELQKVFFEQLTWRAPGLMRGTTLLLNDLPLRFSSDNSLTAPLNWIYAPENHGGQMDYMLYFTSIRIGRAVPALQPGLTIHQNYLAAEFDGSTSQVIALYYQPPGCLRVLDPEIDPYNLLIPPLMRQAAELSQPELILPTDPAAVPLPKIFGAQSWPNWCTFFERAELARVRGDWQAVVDLADQAFELNDYPNDPLERFPFIEGYAHLDNWPRALELTAESSGVSPLVAPAVCRLWQRIDRETPASPQKEAALLTVQDLAGCRP